MIDVVLTLATELLAILAGRLVIRLRRVPSKQMKRLLPFDEIAKDPAPSKLKRAVPIS